MIEADEQADRLPVSDKIEDLRTELEALKAAHARVLIEKDSLERAVEHLNFHENAHDGVLFTDSQDRVIYTNPYFLRMLKLSNQDEVLSKPLPGSMWHDVADADQLFEDIRENGFVRERELPLFDSDGKLVYAVFSGVATRDDDGEYVGAEIMLCNVTNRHTIHAELVLQNDLLDAVLISAPNPVVVLSETYDVIRANPPSVALLAITDDEKDVQFAALLDRRGVEGEVVGDLESALGRGEMFVRELDVGSRCFVLQGAPLSTGQKGWVLVLNDITKSKQAEKALEIRNQELEAYNHTIAHDLKTPLANIIGFAELLRTDMDISSPDVEEALHFIETYAHRMADMIDQLLLLSRLRNPLEVVESVKARPVVEEALDRFQDRIVQRGIRVEIDDTLPTMVGYGPWIEEVFANLISNAIKYIGEENPDPEIVIRGLIDEDDARFEVEDNGVGISAADQPHVFDASSRFHETEALGTGLGLSIVARIVTRLEGEVGVESTPGQGSTFWFSLPAP